MTFHQIKKLLLLKVRYAIASAVATAVDYGLYILLYNTLFDKVTANFISYPIGVLVNFGLQKRYIFAMKRSLRTTFMLAMLVSAGGWALNATLFFLLLKTAFFQQYHLLAKVLVNSLVFFFNFYGKRFVFEKRFFAVD